MSAALDNAAVIEHDVTSASRMVLSRCAKTICVLGAAQDLLESPFRDSIRAARRWTWGEESVSVTRAQMRLRT